MKNVRGFYPRKSMFLKDVLDGDEEAAKEICADVSGEDHRANYRNLLRSNLRCQNYQSAMYDYQIDMEARWYTSRAALGRVIFS